jgi:hypothetical protein
MPTPKTIQLSDDERAPLDEIGALIDLLQKQRSGMLVYIARVKGYKDVPVDYQDGALVVITREGTPE